MYLYRLQIKRDSKKKILLLRHSPHWPSEAYRDTTMKTNSQFKSSALRDMTLWIRWKSAYVSEEHVAFILGVKV
jgi:hypothetical protein